MRKSSAQPESLLAQRLRESMEAQDLSLREVADTVGITYEHVRKAVNGEVIPSKLALKAICSALNLPFEELYKLSKRQSVRNKYADVLSELTGKNPELQPIEDIWDDLTPGHKEDLVNLTKTWAALDRARKEVAHE